MRPFVACVCGLSLVALPVALTSGNMNETHLSPKAAIWGRTTVTMNYHTFPLREVPLYLFTLSQSKALRELQR